MPDFTIRSESVDVEQIMKQIRARIREKRGVDYTEEEIRELAGVKLEKFLDPTKVRSELLEQYRKGRRLSAPPTIVVPPAPPNYAFDGATAYTSSRGFIGSVLRAIRKVLNPLLKLFINPNPILHVLSMQGDINHQNSVRFDKLVESIQLLLDRQDAVRAELDGLNYEVLHNLVLEMTRVGIEVKNSKMRVESLSSRLEFDERRARALEGVVMYRPGAGPAADAMSAQAPPAAPRAEPQGAAQGRMAQAQPETDQSAASKGEALRSRRRRRRRGRQGGGQSGGPLFQQAGAPAGSAAHEGAPGGEPPQSHEPQAANTSAHEAPPMAEPSSGDPDASDQ